MSQSLESRISDWNGVAVVTRFDRETESWIFIHLHDDTLGPCTGGTRMKHYPDLADAVIDGQRLATGMTHKWAGVDMPFGGGKAVIATPPVLDHDSRRGLLRRYGKLLKSLNGAFWTGEDLGTTTEDMALIATETDYVHGFDPATGEKVDPSPYTAHAVYLGLRAGCEVAFGSDDLRGRTIWIQGVGHVGESLAVALTEDGANLMLSDLDSAATERVSRRLDAQVVDPTATYDVECDIYAPCAIGATLTETSVPQLRCRLIAGSANNQLGTPQDAERLHERGILYVPDYIINAGGAVAFALLQSVGSGEALMQRVEPIGQTVRELLIEASEAGESPVHAAGRRVERNLRR